MTIDTPGGLSIVDISTPTAPKEAAFIPGVNSNWQEVTSYRNYAYKVHQLGNVGLQIINLGPLNTGGTPTLVSNFTKYFTNAHTIYCDTANARLFVAYGSTAGVIILSLANPTDPVELSRITGEAHDMFARGDRLYISTQNRGTVETWNISNVAAPALMGVINLRNVNSGLGEPSPMAHSCWPSNDNKTLFTFEEVAGSYTKSFNISNPSAPVYLGRFKARPEQQRISHNGYVHGKYLYVAHNNLGLRIWNIDNPAAMKEEGFHTPSTSTALFGGTWGAYPFFPSGLLIHGDRDLGMYVLEPAAHLKQVGVTPVKGGKRPESRFAIRALDNGVLRFQLPRAGGYTLSIYSPAGKELFRHRDPAASGTQSLALAQEGFSSGNYLLRLRQDHGVFNAAMALP
jgi:choice-of-anchor B domain-containing protein